MSLINRIKNAKKRREKEKKEMDNAARRHLASVRVVQKHLIYISRVIVNRRGHGHTPVISSMAPSGVYVTYVRKEDALRAIEAVDGTVYDGRVVRFVKKPCQNPNCQYLHEPAEEADTYAKEELQAKQVVKQPTPTAIGNQLSSASTSMQELDQVSSSEPEKATVDLEQERVEKKAERSERKKAKKAAAALAAAAAAAGQGQPGTPGSRGSISLEKAPKGEEEELLLSGALFDESDEIIPMITRKGRALEPVTIAKSLTAAVTAAAAAATAAAAAAAAAASSSTSVPVPMSLAALGDEFLSPSVLGYRNHPTYVGPFDPFGPDEFEAILAALKQSQSGAESQVPTTGANGQTFRMDSFSETRPRISPQSDPSALRHSRGTGRPGIEADAPYDGDVDKLEDDRKNVQVTTFSALDDSLSEAEARWGEGFSPSKLANHPEAGVNQWVSQQHQREQLESTLRQAQHVHQQQQQQYANFSGGPRASTGTQGIGLSQGSSQYNILQSRQDMRTQEYLQQQQLLNMQQQAPNAPQMYSRFQQQQNQLQAQQQQSLLLQQQLGMNAHNISQSHNQNEEFLGAFMREAQIRESNIHLRDIQVRERAQAAAAAAVARGEPLGYRDAQILSAKLGVGSINNSEPLGIDRGALLAGRLRPYDNNINQQSVHQVQYGGHGLQTDWPQASSNGLGYSNDASVLRDRAEAIAALRERELLREMSSRLTLEQQQQLHLAQLHDANRERERELMAQVRDPRDWEMLARLQAHQQQGGASGGLGIQPQLQQLPAQVLAGQASPGGRSVLQQGRRRM
ncbi:transcriptional repressor general negative regulator of transcription subunit 4 [Phlyctochytrium bullatum]|nr:transcriptional repressor general negative regulator of transcription subunit 4 [Phlyctochytrium bullatum]